MSMMLPQRKKEAHKGDFGHVLIVGGDYGMPGAVRLAGEAALRTGAGLVSVATRPEHVPVIAAGRPEIMCHGVRSIRELGSLLARATVIVLGPGLGQSDWSKKLFHHVLQMTHPKIVDADALNLLAKKPRHASNWVLTPHVGEAARLLGVEANVIVSHRITAIRDLQQRYGGVIVLKGAGSLVLGKKLYRCRAGNPGMASAGMGDVLSGVIGGLVAQKLALEDATRLGVFIHARAGDLAAKQCGERGMIASDLFPYLHQLVNE